MSRPRRHVQRHALASLLAWAGIALAAPLYAAAQDAGAAQSEALVAPVLLRFVPAPYPEAARSAGLQADVLLRLSIDALGHVTQAEVEQPVGQGFDEAAREACLAFEFEPARRGQQPVAARIRYRYEFRLPPQEPAKPPPAAPAAAPEAASRLPPTAAAEPAVVQVEVRGEPAHERLRDAAAEVQVVDTAEATRHSADLAAVLSRTQGITVARSGGLGSEARVFLHGLSDDQVRLFLDGVPLEAAGYGFGIASVPVAWIERMAVYRGVVPHTLGADALGGAVELTTHRATQGHAAAVSYATGAFDTHSVALRGHTSSERTGLWLSAAAHADTTRNDYVVRVRTPDELGRLQELDVRRFHDGYRALGAQLELGVMHKPWAERLSLRAFGSAFDKELQHNLNMSVPYGAVDYGQRTLGATLRYALPAIGGSPLGVVALLNYSHRNLGFRDKSRSVYDWLGQRVFERPAGAGELTGFASDLTQWEDRVLLRLRLQYTLGAGHALRLSAAPDLAARSGRERLRVDPSRSDPLESDRSVFQLVTGLEHALQDAANVLSNSLFLKHYLYRPASDQVETFDDTRRRLSDSLQRFGAGEALRVRVGRALGVKASYEFATRLPRPDEAFGDGALTIANLRLSPETSHNGNLSLRLQAALPARLGQLTVEAAGFLRRTEDLIVRLPSGDRVHGVFQNVVDVSTLGGDGALQWRSPGRWFGLDANLTWLDMRNSSARGAFAPFKGQRVPNRPYLFANAALQLWVPGVATPQDLLHVSVSTRYVHAFAPDWQSDGSVSASAAVPTQLVHDVSLVYSLQTSPGVDIALDLYNISDERAFDMYGVQKPGRAAYLKLTVCWECASARDTATTTAR